MFEHWIADLTDINQEAGEKLNIETMILCIVLFDNYEDRLYY